MGKTTEKNAKLTGAVIISMVLHALLFATILMWGVWTQNAEMGGVGADNTVIDAVMVDPNIAIEQQRLDEQKKQRLQAQKEAEQAAEKEQIERKRAALAKANEERQQAEAARARAEAEKVAKAQAEAKAREEAKRSAALAAAAKKQAEDDARQAAARARAEVEKVAKAQAKAKEEAEAKRSAALAAAAKKQAEDDAKQAAAEAKKKMDAEAKKKAAEEAKQLNDVNDLFSELIASKNVSTANTVVGRGKHSGISEVDIASYGSQIQAAIKNKFYNWQLYKGRACTLRIKLAPDGLLIDVKAEGGDPVLCQAALAATRQAKIPKPPSKEIYEEFKNAPLDFKL